jgi:hypothetical protein
MPLAMIIEKCVWMFAKPGITALPRPSMSSAEECAATMVSLGPIATIRSLSIAMAAPWWTVSHASTVMTVASWMIVVIACPSFHSRGQ